jgi:hypothetical protein
MAPTPDPAAAAPDPSVPLPPATTTLLGAESGGVTRSSLQQQLFPLVTDAEPPVLPAISSAGVPAPAEPHHPSFPSSTSAAAICPT